MTEKEPQRGIIKKELPVELREEDDVVIDVSPPPTPDKPGTLNPEDGRIPVEGGLVIGASEEKAPKENIPREDEEFVLKPDSLAPPEPERGAPINPIQPDDKEGAEKTLREEGVIGKDEAFVLEPDDTSIPPKNTLIDSIQPDDKEGAERIIKEVVDAGITGLDEDIFPVKENIAPKTEAPAPELEPEKQEAVPEASEPETAKEVLPKESKEDALKGAVVGTYTELMDLVALKPGEFSIASRELADIKWEKLQGLIKELNGRNLGREVRVAAHIEAEKEGAKITTKAEFFSKENIAKKEAAAREGIKAEGIKRAWDSGLSEKERKKYKDVAGFEKAMEEKRKDMEKKGFPMPEEAFYQYLSEGCRPYETKRKGIFRKRFRIYGPSGYTEFDSKKDFIEQGGKRQQRIEEAIKAVVKKRMDADYQTGHAMWMGRKMKALREAVRSSTPIAPEAPKRAGKEFNWLFEDERAAKEFEGKIKSLWDIAKDVAAFFRLSEKQTASFLRASRYGGGRFTGKARELLERIQMKRGELIAGYAKKQLELKEEKWRAQFDKVDKRLKAIAA
ncbi:hypothetical protein KKG36_00310 [Patescibacteria group bacterium]|nr:hypothetical protein [Patescibacteria group bacterium]